jgi:spoIIIJ-associated protein
MASERERIEVSAKTVEEAIDLGLNQLGLAREQVEVEVIHPGRSGVLGIGAEDARVRITTLVAQPVPETPSSHVEVDDRPVASAATEDDVPTEASVAELATALLEELLEHMKVQAQVEARVGDDLAEEGEKAAVILDVTGNDLGILIGRRGETLRALQYMLRLMLSRRLERWEPVIVDVESYRVRRRRLLRQLAARMADRVAFSQQRVVLEAMPAHERRIIHIALRDHPQVTTKSIGEGERRKVTIIPK